MQSVASDHVVDVAQFLQVFSERVHCLCELCALLFNLPSGLDDLLVEDLVTISEVVHASAEDHGVLIHVNSDLALLGHQFNDRLAVFGLFENLVCLLELFEVFDLQEVDQTDGRLELFTAGDGLEEALKLLLTLSEELLCHLVGL